MENQEVRNCCEEVHDRMTECVFDEPLMSFSLDATIPEVYQVRFNEEEALEKVDKELDTLTINFDFSLFRRTSRESNERGIVRYGDRTRNTRGIGFSVVS